MKFRTYHEVTGSDASAIGPQVGRQQQRIEERLARVGLLVGVMSGKGGVGKTYVTAGLALAFGNEGFASACSMRTWPRRRPPGFWARSGPVAVDEEGAPGDRPGRGPRVLDRPAPGGGRAPAVARARHRTVRLAGHARGPGAREFLSDVVWGDLDLLLIDLPPGTDRLQDLAELAPAWAGVVAVTIPSEESRRAVGRAMRADGRPASPCSVSWRT